MTVKTKFDIDEDVYFIHNNKVTENKITGIGVSITEDNSVEIVYYIHYDDIKLPKNKVFGSKDELLESL